MILGEPLRLSLMSREAIGANQAALIVVVQENDCQQVFFAVPAIVRIFLLPTILWFSRIVDHNLLCRKPGSAFRRIATNKKFQQHCYAELTFWRVRRARLAEQGRRAANKDQTDPVTVERCGLFCGLRRSVFNRRWQSLGLFNPTRHHSLRRYATREFLLGVHFGYFLHQIGRDAVLEFFDRINARRLQKFRKL